MGGRQGAEPGERQGDRQGDRRKVVKEHRASHADPIALRAGDLVTVGQRDTTWPPYVWCTGADGRGGWVPETFLGGAADTAAAGETDAAAQVAETGPRARDVRAARRDYDARELDVAPGDVVFAGEEAGGWYWCETSDGRRGWVPAGCLAAEEVKGEQ